MKMLTNLAKAAVATALSPIALVADIVTSPAAAYDNRKVFRRTENLLDTAGDCVKEAVKPDVEI